MILKGGCSFVYEKNQPQSAGPHSKEHRCPHLLLCRLPAGPMVLKLFKTMEDCPRDGIKGPSASQPKCALTCRGCISPVYSNGFNSLVFKWEVFSRLLAFENSH